MSKTPLRRRGLAALVSLALLASALVVAVGPASPAAAAPPYDGVYGGITLVDSQGRVMSGVSVDLFVVSGLSGQPAFMITDGNGQAAIDERLNLNDVWSGAQFSTVQITHFPISNPGVPSNYYLSTTGVSTVFANLAEVQFAATSDNLLELTIPVDEPATVINGIVTIDGGMPAPEAPFYQGWADLYDADTLEFLTSVPVPRAGGGYRFTGVPDGEYLINFVFIGSSESFPVGLLDVWYLNSASPAFATTITIDGASALGINQTMFEASVIDGTLGFDAPGGLEPWLINQGSAFLPAVSVYPSGEAPVSSAALIFYTDSDLIDGTGGYNVAVPAGEYRVTFGLFPNGIAGTSNLDFIPLVDHENSVTTVVGEFTDQIDGLLPWFSDVATSNQFITEITWLASTGISTGYPNGTFRALNSVNRDAMAAFLYRAAGEPTFDPPAVSPFSDVTPSTQFYKEITWLDSTGITTGYPDGTFRPLAPVNRDAMAAFLYRFAGEPEFTPPPTSPFSDVSPSTQFYKEITWLRSTGISTGYSNGTYRPVVPVARDAMAAFLFRYELRFSSTIL